MVTLVKQKKNCGDYNGTTERQNIESVGIGLINSSQHLMANVVIKCPPQLDFFISIYVYIYSVLF